MGKDAGGLKWFETDILCSHNNNISRLTSRSTSAKKGSKLFVTGEVEINESQLYCEIHHFEFISQIGSKVEALKRDSSIWIEDNDNKADFKSPSHRHTQYKKTKQTKSDEKELEQPTNFQLTTTSPSHNEPIPPPSPSTLASDSSSSTPINEKKRPSRRQPSRRRT